MGITIERVGRRFYLIGDTFRFKAQIRNAGGNFDFDDRKQWWFGLTREKEARELVTELNAHVEAAPASEVPTKVKQDPKDIRLTGRGTYKGRSYYMGAYTKDGTRVRLLTLPNDAGEYLDFWADVTQVIVVKTYTPRENTYRGHTTTVYTTLGSIASFIRRQNNPELARGECTECGHYGPRGKTCDECHEGTHV